MSAAAGLRLARIGLALAGRGRLQIAEGEARLQLAERFPFHLRVGVDEIVERFAALRGAQVDIAPERELDAVRIVRPEEVIALGRILPSFRGVRGHPAETIQIELGPAVVAGNVSFGLVLRQRKADLEPGWNTGGAHHPDEQRVEIGAVAALGRAGPNGVAAAPALA